MTNFSKVNRPAPLRNVAAFSTLMHRVVDRSLDVPGMATFFGPSGLGKTKSAIYGANQTRSLYVECDQFTTAKSLISMILMELGVSSPKGTVTALLADAIKLMSGDIRRPLIIDEAHHIAHKKFIDIARSLHDKSMAPVILIGEETLPAQLEAFERVHNRMLEWCQAVPCDADDFSLLCDHALDGVTLSSDLTNAILAKTRGNTRRIVVNLDRAAQIARRLGVSTVNLEQFGGPQAINDGRAPLPRAVR